MREIASSLLFDTAGRFLFQQRDDIAGITEPGKIGLFGGHKEGNETFVECIARELSEEIGINLRLERFQPLIVYQGIDVEIGGPIRAEFFVVRDISLAQIRIAEGSLVVANAESVPRLGGRLTAYARLALKAFGTTLNNTVIAHRPRDAIAARIHEGLGNKPTKPP
jgi:8-oxo-dGTP pyrophosphatase MutT (NUDIX family)